MDSLQKKIQELELHNERLDQEIEKFLKELKVTPEQLSLFIDNVANFTPKNWKELQEVKQELQTKLNTELTNIRNPLKSKKAFSERSSARHWIFMK